MRRIALVLGTSLALAALARLAGAQPFQSASPNLSLVEALAVVERSDLVGVFAFVPETQTAAAFADFLVRNEKALGRYLSKVEKDLKAAGGLTSWDHDVLRDVVSTYGSPMGEVLKKPKPKIILRMADMAGSPVLTFEEIGARRRKA